MIRLKSKTALMLTLACLMMAGVPWTNGQVIKDVSIDTMHYGSLREAALAWVGALAAQSPRPTRVDGIRGLKLPCHFRTGTKRAIWDKEVNLDFSPYNYLYFRFKCPDISVIDKISIYFQSNRKNWYVYHAAVPLLTDQWQSVLIPLSRFHKPGTSTDWSGIKKIRISVWQRKNVPTRVFISDMRIQKIKVVNLVHNSGFEACSIGLVPDYWGPGHWGLKNEHWITHMDDWRASWGVDQTEHYQGKQSLRVIQSPDTSKRKVVSTFFPIASNQPYTFSAWLKSDQAEASKVHFKIYTLKKTWLSKILTVTDTWKRYECHFTPARTSSQARCEISTVTEGTLWIDNVQVEKGEVATAYQPTPKDITLTGKAVQNHEPTIPDYVTAACADTKTVRIDTHRRFLVNGKPFIPTALGWESSPTSTAIKHMALAGFNTLCFTAHSSETASHLRALMTDAQAHGLKVILWIGKKVTYHQMTDWVNELKDHPALIAWYVYDEPGSPKSWKQAHTKYQIAKSLDTAHPAYTNLLFKQLKKDYPSDILSMDYYPLTFWSPATVSTYVKKLEGIATKTGKPSWTWLQDSGYAYFIFREPTDAETQCMTYLALIHGSRGIKFFAHQPLGAGLWNEMRRLTGEIKKLTPILYSLEKSPVVSTTSSPIHLLGKTYQGKKYIIAVNDLPSSIKATIKMAALPRGSARVLFEGRIVPIRRSQIKDIFKAYQRHVYQVVY